MPFDKKSYDSGPSVYTDGVRALGNDTFIVYAGGADQVVEAVKIKVAIWAVKSFPCGPRITNEIYIYRMASA